MTKPVTKLESAYLLFRCEHRHSCIYSATSDYSRHCKRVMARARRRRAAAVITEQLDEAVNDLE